MHFSVKNRIKSFYYAFNGIKLFLKSQHNSWIQVSIGIIAIVAGIFFNIKQLEWCVIILCIGCVLSLETLNSAIEKLADTLHPESHEGIRDTKDLAAGAVLIAAIASFIIGWIIFLPYIFELFR